MNRVNKKKLATGVSNTLHVNGVELLMAKVVLFVPFWGLNLNQMDIHCTNRGLFVQLSLLLVQFCARYFLKNFFGPAAS